MRPSISFLPIAFLAVGLGAQSLSEDSFQDLPPRAPIIPGFLDGHPKEVRYPEPPPILPIRNRGYLPVGAGPLFLTAVHRSYPGQDVFTLGSGMIEHGVVSPDRQRVAFRDWYGTIVIGPVGSDEPWVTVALPLPGGAIAAPGADSLIWSEDGRTLLTAYRPGTSLSQRGKWRENGVFPSLSFVRIDRNGSRTSLPTPELTSHRIDTVYWFTERRVVVELDARAYLGDLDPTAEQAKLAIINPTSGEVLDMINLPFRQIYQISAVTLPDGRLKAIVNSPNGWLIWTEGEPERLMEPLFPAAALALSPDGRQLLVNQFIQRDPITPYDIPSYDPPSPTEASRVEQIPLFEDSLRTLIDLETGEPIWTVRGVVAKSSGGTPVFSPDGRFAILGAPTSDEYRPIALIDTHTGETLQMLNIGAGTYKESFGFADNGRSLWVHQQGTTAIYDVR